MPEIYVVTFSDSALLYADPELEMDGFYSIVHKFRSALNEMGKVYCVVSRGTEVGHHVLPALGSVVRSGGGKAYYFNVAGSGQAWVNLHLADAEIKKHRDLHSQFWLYCVGADSLPNGRADAEGITFTSFSGSATKIFAIE